MREPESGEASLSPIEESAEISEKAWDELCPAASIVARFEALADLYYRRYRTLAPGKDSAAASGEDSSSAENRKRFDLWVASGQALQDAVARVVELTEGDE